MASAVRTNLKSAVAHNLTWNPVFFKGTWVRLTSTAAPSLIKFAEWFRSRLQLVPICTILSLESYIDLLLVGVYWAYLILRVYGVYAHSEVALSVPRRHLMFCR